MLGIGGILKPDLIGQVLVHYLQRTSENQRNESISQNQSNTSKSTQALAKDKSKLTVNNYYGKAELPEKDQSDEKKELIKEVNNELSKEKLSNILIKCIRLAKVTNSKKDIFWLENEVYGFEKNKNEVNSKDIPSYRTITSEIRVGSHNDPYNYQTLHYNLILGQPIFQIEEWIEKYERSSSSSETYITGPMTENFRKAHRSVFGIDPKDQNLSYFVPASELKKVLNGLKLRISDFVNSKR